MHISSEKIEENSEAKKKAKPKTNLKMHQKLCSGLQRFSILLTQAENLFQ